MGKSGLLVALAVGAVVLPNCGAGLPAPATAPPIEVAALRSVPPVHPEPRVTLTASDGTGLRLVDLTARAVVDEPLALTELHLAFENPQERTVEGTFRITLPPGATVSRFAMRIADHWQEGEVVELQAARRAYEDFLHRKQDPALLEQAAGSEFSARVFPIPAHTLKELILSYSQEIEPGNGYTLPLGGLPELGALDVEVTRAGAGTPEIAIRDAHRAPHDVVLAPRATALHGTDRPTEGMRSGELVLARVRPEVNEALEPMASTVVLFDTSASRALGFTDQLNLLTRLVDGIARSPASGPAAPLAVACFDQTIETVYEGKAGNFGAAQIAAIERRGALGASDVERALVWAGGEARKGAYKRVVLISDGVATMGATEDDKLVTAARALNSQGVDRLDAVAVGGIRDDAGLRRIVTAGLVHDGVVADGTLDEPSLARRLTRATRSGVPVRVAGASWWWPRTIDGVQPGEERTVYAEVAGAGPVTIEVGGKVTVASLRATERPLLERSLAQAKIASLLDQQAAAEPGSQNAQATTKQIIQLSVAHRVISPFTAMIVLETERDYERFQIDRHALADILTIDHGAIATANRSLGDGTPQVTAGDRNVDETRKRDDGSRAERTDRTLQQPAPAASSGNPVPQPEAPPAMAALAPPPPASPRPVMEAEKSIGGLGLTGAGAGGGGRGEGIGLGNIGTIGHGAGTGTGQGFGNGHGRLSGAHTVDVPTIRQGAVQVNGRLPPEVIQRIVRQNFGRFRLCYENGLRQNPQLAGTVAVRFTIDRTGAVTTVADASSTLHDSGVVACVMRGFGNLSFPQPEGGAVTVVYPIVFAPGEGGGRRWTPPGPIAIAPQGPPPPPPPPPPPQKADPYTGQLKSVMDALAHGDVGGASAEASQWHSTDPGDVLGLVALGETLEASGDTARAARAYGSIIDLFGSRADLRRFAGNRLEHLRGGDGLDLAIDDYEKAKQERPDHPASHRELAYALVKKGAFDRAFEAVLDGMHQKYPGGRFAGVDQVLREDLGLVAAAWIKSEPRRREEIERRVTEAGGTLENAPSLRFVLTWETDANDVDFHIFDAKNNHAFYGAKTLASGGSLYADITTGYGPECFTIRAPKGKRAGPYTLQANYYSRGPMGYGMGKLEIIEHDGAGTLTFDERPYVVMVDHAFVDLGTVDGSPAILADPKVGKPNPG
jgi:tetratricopeptide (TPR) repeat protein